MNKKWMTLGILIIMASVLLTSCDKKIMYVGSSTKSKISGSYKFFTGTEEKKLSMKSGETISIDYKSKVEEGQLSMKLYGPDNQVLTELATNESGTEKVKADKDGKYRIEIKGEETKGSFKVAFKVE
ncbi:MULTISPECIES: hypothetical protein [unclassified Paenibacillus]|uniref:hypothetical protein n=1 Tax=unclassified Paenibacillus TaxID=185978 RepID=UPI0003E259FC|nr:MULTISPECIES: hypothetical protein [unclassified Paenibacillus]ETT52400.1 hypothetical protein C162_08961 [Paenibacillus sp. FSL R7-269]OMF95526.1 hypothetical protein BK147_14855 [Paenibacillus sp. FSL R7-0337]